MKKVFLREKKIWVDETPVFPLSGEVHFWRLDPDMWLPILKRVKEMGLNMVATYVCWEFHEIAPGKYDFQGRTKPQRNLIQFLDLLKEQGLWVFLRPGPYIYSEWRNGGVPDRVARFHRLHPTFQDEARTYMQAVVEVTRSYLASQGGNILLWQADNEIDLWPHWYTESLGLGKQPGLFQEFLRQKYGDIQLLNEAWRAQYQTFEEARAVSRMFVNDPVLMARYLDFVRFQHDYVNRVAAWAVNTYRELGVDVPIVLNTYSGVGTQQWGALETIADLVGPDIYPSVEFNQRPVEHRNFLEAVRYTRTYSRLPYIPEFEAGIWHDWLPDVGALPPNHYRLMGLSALMAGAAGWNWYMLVNRDNWYQSPINERGYTRPNLYKEFSQIVDLYERLDPTTLSKVVSSAVTFSPSQRASERPGQALLQAFYDADIDYEFFDLEGEAECSLPILFYSGGNWLPAKAQQRLAHYVERGGHLVLLGVFPYLDETLLPCNLLNIPHPDGVVNGLMEMPLRLSWGLTVTSPWCYHFSSVPGEPIQAERLQMKDLPAEELSLQWNLQTGEKYTIGYTQRYGAGRVTMLGLAPSAELLNGVHHFFQIPIPVQSQTSGVLTALFQRGVHHYIIAVNAGNEEKTAMLRLDARCCSVKHGTARDMLTGEVRPFDFTASPTLSLPLGRKTGTVLSLEGA